MLGVLSIMLMVGFFGTLGFLLYSSGRNVQVDAREVGEQEQRLAVVADELRHGFAVGFARDRLRLDPFRRVGLPREGDSREGREIARGRVGCHCGADHRP